MLKREINLITGSSSLEFQRICRLLLLKKREIRNEIEGEH